MPASSLSPSVAGSSFMDGDNDSTSTTPTTSHHRAVHAPNSTLLREQQAEYERLKIDTFNQALRINFLEERLLRYKHGTAFESEDLENEVFQMRLTLQERENELKHKSLTIVRATEYMKQLQDQIRDAHAEIERLRASPRPSPTAAAGDLAAAQYRVELEHAHAREQSQRKRIAALEDELGQHQDTVASMTATTHELSERAAEHERTVAQLQQAVARAEAALAVSRTEVEQWRSHATQRESDETARVREQLAALEREKEQSDARAQTTLARLESQVAALERDADKLRSETTSLRSERDHARFESERVRLEADAAQQERARLESEIERLATELERVTGDAEAFRLQTVKLTATCEHKTQTLESLKRERESVLETAHNAETELRQWRSACADREVSIKSLEHRVQVAEDDAARVRAKLELAAAQSQQTTHERLRSVESERERLEQETYRLRKDVAAREHDAETLERRVESLETQVRDAQTHARTVQDALTQCERELQERTRELQGAEQQLTAATTAVSSTEAARQQQQTEDASRFAVEKSELLRALHDEQEHADAVERRLDDLERAHAAVTDDLEAIRRELSAASGRNERDGSRPLAQQLRDVIQSIRRSFASATDAIVAQHEQQTALLTKQMEQLAQQLSASEGKLEVLQRTTVHVQDDKQTIERTWATRYDKLRTETERERRALEAALRDAETAKARSDAALARATSEVDALTRAKETSRADLERTYDDLKQSNRVLLDEVQECRRAAAHARKQHLRSVRENKDLLAAIDVYKTAVTDREKELASYKSALVKRAQQLEPRVSLRDVKQTLLEQLEHTQYMINETYKRWSESELGASLPGSSSDADAAVVVHLDEYIGRLEIVTERWNEFLSQARDLERRAADATRSAVRTSSPDRPAWVDDVERKSRRLLNESVRVSEALRDVVENVLSVIQRERNERKAFRAERLAGDAAALAQLQARRPKDWDNDGAAALGPRLRRSTNQQLSPRALAGGAADGGVSLEKHSAVSRARRTSSSSSSSSGPVSPAARRRGDHVYVHSLAGLGRIGAELQAIEKKIQTYEE